VWMTHACTGWKSAGTARRRRGAIYATTASRNAMPARWSGSLNWFSSRRSATLASPPASDAAGALQSWNAFTQANAAIETVRGTDVIKGGQTATQLFLTVGMWYQAGINPEQRVLSDNGSLYVIQSVENILEMNVVLVLNCLALGSNQ
jgi:Phage head-tail joining protein